MSDVEEAIARRLEELGVRTSDEEVRELASVHDALEVWMRMAEELARADEREPDR